MNLLKLEGNGKTAEASDRRRVNLSFIEQLSLEGLSYQQKERMILLYKTQSGEELYLQYPGKESVRSTNKNPRDFRPKIIFNNKQGPDLTFGDVWGSFFDLLKTHSISDDKFLKAIDYLIVLFYKSSYYIDFITVDNPVFFCKNRKDDVIKDSGDASFQGPVLIFNQDIHRSMFEFIEDKIGKLCGMSIEGFVLYNDILAWNEDYKYYSRALANGLDWSGNGVGKPNNPLTHIHILGYIRGEFDISDVLMRFVQRRGVSVPNNRELQHLFDSYINPEIEKMNSY